MRLFFRLAMPTVLLSCAVLSSGCAHSYFLGHTATAAASPLGTLSDPIWQMQEANAEVSDFVFYQHEFDEGTPCLNFYGQDHVKQVAMRLLAGQDVPVMIERSMIAVRLDTEYKYPIHPDPQLDMQRRQTIVHYLSTLGIQDADRRVIVATPLAEPYRATEARRAYERGLMGWGSGAFSNRGGFGSFGGGFGF
jgi:hypothetical protein